jgi:NADH:ubiquinone oxidoreductase subunit C
MHNNLNIYYLFINYIFKIIPKIILLINLKQAEISISTHANNLIFLTTFFKKHTNTLLNFLNDICAVDYPNLTQRFLLVYNFYSLKYNYRIRFLCSLIEFGAVKSLSFLYKCSSWWEREVWDLFGVFFFDHTRLKRILSDYGFIGYPLRKDFPISGFFEVRYSETLQKVLYEPLEFKCNFRHTLNY